MIYMNVHKHKYGNMDYHNVTILEQANVIYNYNECMVNT